eukprot:TRINITY_DN37892_c0_g1_i1.p1 TRINITY_DN37892_c0_g1~~TRINITY_DN37892_c0_g1_i1.p1  ORF type:complete len:118 (+),score=1.07 TRINITY_DN37892_c0_g1_i1:94-447(+)
MCIRDRFYSLTAIFLIKFLSLQHAQLAIKPHEYLDLQYEQDYHLISPKVQDYIIQFKDGQLFLQQKFYGLDFSLASFLVNLLTYHQLQAFSGKKAFSLVQNLANYKHYFPQMALSNK